MRLQAVLRAYGLWLLGVLSAAAAAYFLHRSRVLSVELEDELGGDGYEVEGGALPAHLEDYT